MRRFINVVVLGGIFEGALEQLTLQEKPMTTSIDLRQLLDAVGIPYKLVTKTL